LQSGFFNIKGAKMYHDLAKGLKEVYATLSRRHGQVVDSCPAEMNGIKGILGYSKAIYFRVWFDTADDSTTMFTTFKRHLAKGKYTELKAKYGK